MTCSPKSGLIVFLTALVSGILAGAAVYGASNPEAVVKYRIAVMRAQSAHLKAIKAIIDGKVGFTGRLADHALALDLSVRGVADLFPAGTGPDKVKSRSKAEIWRDRKKFDAMAGKLEEETAKLVRLVNGGEKKTVAAQYKAINRACRACHKPFRVKKKRKKKK